MTAVNLLMFSRDSTFFSGSTDVGSDTLSRHIKYIRLLEHARPGSQIRIITYTSHLQPDNYAQPVPGLHIYGTRSRYRMFYLIGVLQRLRKVMADGWRPNLVTAQTPWEEGTLAIIISYMMRVPYIAQLHFDLLSPYWRAEHVLNTWRAWIARYIIKHADRVRVVSEKLSRDLQAHLGVPQNRMCVVPVSASFTPKKVSKYQLALDMKLDGRDVVLFVGRFYAPKNLTLWIEVAHLIKKKFPNVIFLMVGSGPEVEGIKRIVHSIGLDADIVFTGSIAHEVLPAIYNIADVLLLTSLYESFGRVVVESYLSEVPVVSTETAGTLELIQHGKTGYIIPQGDAEGLAEAVVTLLQDKCLRWEMGKRGKQDINSRYDPEIHIKRLVDCWLSATEPSRQL